MEGEGGGAVVESVVIESVVVAKQAHFFLPMDVSTHPRDVGASLRRYRLLSVGASGRQSPRHRRGLPHDPASLSRLSALYL